MVENTLKNSEISVAIVDDDLAEEVTVSDLRSADTSEQLLRSLEDDTDPLYGALIEVLKKHNKEFGSLDEIAVSLNDPTIFDEFPSDVKSLLSRARSKRQSSAAPLKIIEKWIKTNYETVKIHKFSNTQVCLQSDENFDILLVDYLLVGDDESYTKKFITDMKERNTSEANCPLFILMSSHKAKLEDDFISLKTELKMTSSRFRILEKPINDTLKYEWMHTIDALLNERNLVPMLEDFINQWGNRFKQSASRMADELWALDAYSLFMLRQAAAEDQIEFYEYFSEIIMRKALAEIESADSPHAITSSLGKAMDGYDSIAPGTEISDSREVVRKLINEFCWHKDWLPSRSDLNLRDTFENSDFRDSSDQERNKFLWINSQLCFGSVLQNMSGNLFVHLTQPCDSARLSYENSEIEYLFFLPGTKKPLDSTPISQYKESQSPSMFLDKTWSNIHWNLNNPLSYSVKDLMASLEEYKLVGRLRNDLAQKVLVEYVTKISRVASINAPTFLKVAGCLAISREGSRDWTIEDMIDISAHIRKNGDKFVFEAEPREALKYFESTLPEKTKFDIDKIISTICKGVPFKFDKQQELIQNNDDTYILVLNEEVFSGRQSLESGMQRMRDKNKLKANSAKTQIMGVFARA